MTWDHVLSVVGNDDDDQGNVSGSAGGSSFERKQRYANTEGVKLFPYKDNMVFEYFSHDSSPKNQQQDTPDGDASSPTRYMIIFCSFFQTAAGFQTNYRPFYQKNNINVICVTLPGWGLSSYLGNTEKHIEEFSSQVVRGIMEKEWGSMLASEKQQDQAEIAIVGFEYGMKYAMAFMNQLNAHGQFKNRRLALFGPMSSFTANMNFMYSTVLGSYTLAQSLFEGAPTMFEGDVLSMASKHDREALEHDICRSLQLGYGSLARYAQNFTPRHVTSRELNQFVSHLREMAAIPEVKRIFISFVKDPVISFTDGPFQDKIHQLCEAEHQIDIPNTTFDFQEYDSSEGSLHYVYHYMELISRLFDIQTLFFSPV